MTRDERIKKVEAVLGKISILTNAQVRVFASKIVDALDNR